ncbi:DUF7146 domain-containing protein [Stappia indica]|uniref:DUF7146 domain-containing protein n=1 Tax=Stappia indica TaxID=538381 RepID=A0A857C5U5_9HYPH|nr:hypothetical protein [Stappia indica]QGZ33932.1 hypothetical protein GH266_05045 [Stappia indica]
MTSRFAIAKQVALDHLETLIPELFGSGAAARHKRGGLWNVVWPWRARAKASQTVIWLSGARRGGWTDFVSGDKGDVIDLVAAVQSGAVTSQSRVDAVAWIEDRFNLSRLDEATRERMAAEARTRRVAVEAAEEQRREAMRARARKMFFSCQDWRGTLVETYLREARGIELRDVPNVGNALRFHPSCEYWLGAPRDADGKRCGEAPRFPAMIGAMVDRAGRIGACHYTFLAPDGRDKAQAIPFGDDVAKAKMMFPETQGLRIRLTLGPSGLGMEQAAEAGVSGIEGITEGIEDGLSAAWADGELRMSAAGSLSGYLSLYDHAAASGYLLFRDNDWDNPQAAATFDKALARMRRFDKPVEPVAMPASWGKDVNDVLRSE